MPKLPPPPVAPALDQNPSDYPSEIALWRAVPWAWWLPLWGVLLLWAGFVTGWAVAPTLSLGLLGGLLLALALVDVQTRLLPNTMVLLILAAGLADSLLLGHLPWWDAAGGLLAYPLLLGGASLLAGWWAGKPALGGGDLKLLAALGPWLGLTGLPLFMLLLAVGGLTLVLARRWFAHSSENPTQLPFAPALAMAAWATVLHSEAYWQCIRSLTA
jgi:prepilin signal peptidase PulO-like enzyme (type II secretory pathway)